MIIIIIFNLLRLFDLFVFGSVFRRRVPVHLFFGGLYLSPCYLWGGLFSIVPGVSPRSAEYVRRNFLTSLDKNEGVKARSVGALF